MSTSLEGGISPEIEGSIRRDLADLSKWHLLFTVVYFVISSLKWLTIETRLADLKKRLGCVKNRDKIRWSVVCLILKRTVLGTTIGLSDQIT